MTSDSSGPGDRDDEPFLSRWSRRKVAARTDAVPAPPTVPVEVTAPIAPAPAATEAPPTQSGETGGARSQDAARPLPDVDSLSGVASDYRDFMQPGVDETTRRAALRKLFADPHFNRMDGLDVYIDDYGVPDPLPPAMLAALAVTKRLIVDPATETPEAFALGRREADVRPADATSDAPALGPVDDRRAEPGASAPVPPAEPASDAPPPPPDAVASATLPPEVPARTKPE